MKKIIIRSLIIASWIALIFGCLYLPRINFISYDSHTLNVFAWGSLLDPEVIKQFEKKMHCKVNISYYSSNEELLTKLKATKGEGYDIVMPSDYAVNILAHEQLLKPIDKSKLTFWKDINPNLLGHEFDPQNEYSIPFEWEIFVFGIDKDYFKTHPLHSSWKLVFDQNEIDYKISMTNDPIEAIQLAGFYLYGNVDQLTQQQALQVKNLLITQKSWVEAYASFRGDYFLATQNCPVAVATSSYIWRTMRQFPFVSFVVPKEGTFITIENLAIPILSKKEELTYQFINFIMSHDSAKAHFNSYGFFPATLQSAPDLQLDPEAEKLIHSSQEDFKKFYFITELLSQQEINDIWVEVKSGKY